MTKMVDRLITCNH